MKKAIWAIIILIIVIIAIVWIAKSGPAKPPVDENSGNATSTEEIATTTEELGEDEPSAINNQLEGIDVGELEDEFEGLDEDLKDL